MASQKLNQVIAVEKSVKARALAEVTELYNLARKPQLFDGHSKSYQKLADDGETLPPEGLRVQAQALDTVRQVSNRLSELFDTTLTKDIANTAAKADVVVDGEVLAKAVPATFLLFLEKQLTDVHTFVKSLPVLDPAKEWSLDPNAQLYKTAPVTTVRTKKVQKSLVLLAPTDKHPGQAQLITEDQTVGTWSTTHLSGALPAPAKAGLVNKVEKLQKAVKVAREEANCVEATQQSVGEKLFTWLFA